MPQAALVPNPKRAPTSALLTDLRDLIDAARQHVAQTVNATLTMLYWHVGQRIRREVLNERRAGYGEEIVSTLSTQLVRDYGQGFGVKNLARMVQFAEVFPDEKIVVTLSRQLNWSHFVVLLPLRQPLEREYYAELCRVERWSVRTLRERIASQLYLRTAIAKKPESVVQAEIDHLREGGQMTPDLVFRDPYMLDFLGLPRDYSERDLEDAILREMERFLLEMGVGFTFVARQKRISVGADDFYLDLLFYHRHLKRLVAVELKLEKFQPAHKGQMELYLRWLDKHDRAKDEEAPIGLILCASKDAEQVELLDLGASHIRVAEYLAHIPDMKILQAQLHRAVLLARERATRAASLVDQGKDALEDQDCAGRDERRLPHKRTRKA
ncbi:MAG: PDDEXK nuclease domain-containing protein [Zoogloeaceae bacterium]|jgi:predicted nuclease of restriction endonuclease-like (RecB) superfamily|nr:PDDEXK nuclease domain-containing protein [Zoogloeaceae bacterium]